MQASIQIANKFKPLFSPSRYKVFYGGRGGAKSWAFAQALILKASQGKLLILCARELQGSIQESVHRLLSKTIERMGLNDVFDIQQRTIKNIQTGSEFIFEGLWNNVTKIKSMEGVDIVWVEEAESVSENSWDVLIPTIRKPGSEIWVCFNPAFETDPTYKRFVANPPPEYTYNADGSKDRNYIGARVNWRDNPWFPVELRKEMEHMRETEFVKYLHVWEGECLSESDLQLIPADWVKAAQDRWEAVPPEGVPMCAMGVDVAQGGEDNTVIAPRHDGWFAELIITPGTETPYGRDVAGRIFAHRRDGADIIVDMGGGYGGATYEQLSQSVESRHLHKYKGAESTNQRALHSQLPFKNTRAMAYYRFYEALDPSQPGGSPISLPPSDRLREELCSIRLKTIDMHIIELEPKKELIKRLGRSPDESDAVVMAWHKGSKNANIEGGFNRRGSYKPQVQMGRSGRRR